MIYDELFEKMRLWLGEHETAYAQCYICGKGFALRLVEFLAYKINPALKIYCIEHTPKRRCSGKSKQTIKWMRDFDVVMLVGIKLIMGEDDEQILVDHEADGLTKKNLAAIRDYFERKAVATAL